MESRGESGTGAVYFINLNEKQQSRGSVIPAEQINVRWPGFWERQARLASYRLIIGTLFTPVSCDSRIDNSPRSPGIVLIFAGEMVDVEVGSERPST